VSTPLFNKMPEMHTHTHTHTAEHAVAGDSHAMACGCAPPAPQLATHTHTHTITHIHTHTQSHTHTLSLREGGQGFLHLTQQGSGGLRRHVVGGRAGEDVHDLSAALPVCLALTLKLRVQL
jgi:hypothetical protein